MFCRSAGPKSTGGHSESESNAFPPFDFPNDVRILEANTRQETRDLQQLANSLEQEVRETLVQDKYSIRLQNFIDKMT